MALGGVVAPNSDLDVLDTALDGCLEVPLACLSAEDVSDRLARLQGLTAKLDAVRVSAVSAGKVHNIGRLSDQRNVANHVAAVSNADPGAVRFDQRIADWLTDMPIIAEAFARGVISTAHIELVRKADNPRVHLQMVDSQDMFVGWFTTIVFRDLEGLLNEWLLGADPDGAEPNAQYPETGMTVQTVFGGMVKVTLLLDPLQGAALKGDLAPECARLRAEEQQTGETRPVRKRQLQALLNLTGRGANRPDGTTARPRVHIVMSQRVYEETLAWLEDPTFNDLPTIDRSDIDSKCQLIDGTPIHPLYGLAASLTAKFRHTVYSARGRPIHDSYDTRSIPEWMKDIALVTSNGKCSNPICDAPFAWLHGDHITPYSHTRDTSVANTRPVCEPDNGWRGNDTNRGHWGNDQPPTVDQRAQNYRDEQDAIAQARSRIHTLIAEQNAR